MRIFRWPRSMAQPTVGHPQRVAEIEARAAAIPGLHLAGNACHGIGIPDCIRMGARRRRRFCGDEPDGARDRGDSSAPRGLPG